MSSLLAYLQAAVPANRCPNKSRDMICYIRVTEVLLIWLNDVYGLINQDIVVALNLLTDSMICEPRAALKRHAGVVTV